MEIFANYITEFQKRRILFLLLKNKLGSHSTTLSSIYTESSEKEGLYLADCILRVFENNGICNQSVCSCNQVSKC